MRLKRAANSKRPMVQRVRMIDIAREAGVSQPTVSCVLNGRETSARISAKTADRIRLIAKRLQFHPNQAAQQLAGKRSGVVAVLARNFFHLPQARALSFVSHLCSSRGLETLGWASDSKAFTFDEYVNKCLAREVEGLFLITLNRDTLRPQEAEALARLPHVISLFDDPGIPGGYCIDYDSADGVRQAVTHLHNQGRRRIVQVLENLDTMMSRRRHQGFVAAHQELGRPLTRDQSCLATEGWSRDDYPKFAALLDELIDERGADATIADNDYTASFLATAVRRRGLRMPEDVALVGWGNEIVAGWMNPGLATVDHRLQDMVTAALDLLTGLTERPGDDHPRSILVKPKLLLRETV